MNINGVSLKGMLYKRVITQKIDCVKWSEFNKFEFNE